MSGSLGLRLDPRAVGDPQPTGLNSLNDILFAILSNPQLRALVDDGLVAANPISDGGCGIFACTPEVDTMPARSTGTSRRARWPSSRAGGLRASVILPGVALRVSACGTTCCIGGSNITVTASSITATVDFGLR